MNIHSITRRHEAPQDAARITISRRRRASGYIREPAERGKLDALAGLMLWLTLTHGFAGTGIGLALGLLAGAQGGSA